MVAYSKKKSTTKSNGYSTKQKQDQDKLSFYGISIGRVQNPMLRVVVEKFLDPLISGKGIELKKRLYVVDKKGIKWEYSGNKKYETNHEALQKAYQGLINEFKSGNKDLIVTNIDKKKSCLKRKEPFNLSSLQKECSSILKIKPKDVLTIAQKLYENGFTSYPRTDSITITESIEKKIKSALGSDFKHFEYKDKGEFIQEGHHALVFVTPKFSYKNGEVSFSNIGLGDREQKVYELVVRRTLAAFYKDDVEVETQTYTGSYTIKGKNLDFNYQEKKVTEKGWSNIYVYIDVEGDCDTYKKGDNAGVKEFLLNDVDIKISVNISTNTLQKIVQEKGISRPSTWATMLENLKNKQLIEFDNQGVNIFIKPKGIWFWFLLKYEFHKNNLFETFDLELTKFMEDNLDEIASGKKDHIEFMNEILEDCFQKYL